jgi:hypothetical protein
MLTFGALTIHQQALATITATNLPYPPQHGTLVINDPLRDNSAGYNWEIKSNSAGHCAFGKGTYHALVTQVPGLYYCRAQSLTLTNFAVQVNVTIVAGDRGGIVFRCNQTSGYFFTIDRNGFYSLITFANARETRLTGGVNPAIAKSQTYLLAIVVINRQPKEYSLKKG